MYSLLTFHPKGGSLGGLSQTGEGVELEVGGQSLDQADGHRAFTFAQWSGSYPRYKVNTNLIHRNCNTSYLRY